MTSVVLRFDRKDWSVKVIPVAVNGVDDAHRVEMAKGVQSFHVGPDFWDTKEEADGFAAMLMEALNPCEP